MLLSPVQAELLVLRIGTYLPGGQVGRGLGPTARFVAAACSRPFEAVTVSHPHNCCRPLPAYQRPHKTRQERRPVRRSRWLDWLSIYVVFLLLFRRTHPAASLPTSFRLSLVVLYRSIEQGLRLSPNLVLPLQASPRCTPDLRESVAPLEFARPAPISSHGLVPRAAPEPTCRM